MRKVNKLKTKEDVYIWIIFKLIFVNNLVKKNFPTIHLTEGKNCIKRKKNSIA